jgi:hypothetical protein
MMHKLLKILIQFLRIERRILKKCLPEKAFNTRGSEAFRIWPDVVMFRVSAVHMAEANSSIIHPVPEG